MKIVTLIATLVGLSSTTTHANVMRQRVQSQAELEVRSLVQPLLERYCANQCRLLAIDTDVDLATPDQFAPGFEDLGGETLELKPAFAKVKILMDEMLGPQSRDNLVALIQQHTNAMAFPVTYDVSTVKFPVPPATSRRIVDLRKKVESEFKDTMNSLFQQFCAQRCTFADFNLDATPVNIEEAQYGGGDVVYDGEVALRINGIGGTILMDTSLTPVEQFNILEMARLKTKHFKNVSVDSIAMKFPDGLWDPEQFAKGKRRSGVLGNEEIERTLASEKSEKKEESNLSKTEAIEQKSTESKDSKATTETKESVTRIERYETIEQADGIRTELEEIRRYAFLFGACFLALLLLIAATAWRASTRKDTGSPLVHKIVETIRGDSDAPDSKKSLPKNEERNAKIAKRFEIERLHEELTQIFAEHPRVAKHVFTRVLKEEGIETTAAYIHLFSESVVMDLLRDASLQQDLHELTEYYATQIIDLEEEEKLELLRNLHNRAIASKLIVLGNRSSSMFEFLAEMDPLQILEMIRNESVTVKAVVLTQCDTGTRANIYSKLDDRTRMSLLTELSRIDYLPKAYIHNLAGALQRKRVDNPRLNTESLPGSDVLVTLLERTDYETQRTVIHNLENTNPDNARNVKGKLVSIDTLNYLRDHQLLEVVLSLRHDELLQFLKGTKDRIRDTIFSKSPKDLVSELSEELEHIDVLSREAYNNLERKVLNRIKTMAETGAINLIEVNERMFGENSIQDKVVESTNVTGTQVGQEGIKKVSGW